MMMGQAGSLGCSKGEDAPMNRLTLATAPLALALAAAAAASPVPVLNVPITPTSGGYRFDYTATLSNDHGLAAGDYLVIYDFKGFTGAYRAPANWTLTTPLTSPAAPIPPGLTDDPRIVNLVFTYKGPSVQASVPPGGGTDIDYRFMAVSIHGAHGKGGFAVVAKKNHGPGAGAGIVDAGVVEVPHASAEPGPWALMLLGAGLAGGLLRRRSIGRGAGPVADSRFVRVCGADMNRA